MTGWTDAIPMDVQIDDGEHPGERRRVAVLRVDVRGEPMAGLMIVLLEIDRHAARDRLLGTATTPERACQIVRDWLYEMTTE